MADYKGGGGDVQRMRDIQKKREQEKKAYEAEKAKAQAAANVNIRDKFATRKVSVEDQLKEETIGLVTLDSFRKKKQELDLAGPILKEPERKKRKERVETSSLSFMDDDNGEEGEEEDADMAPPPAKRIAKDPGVDTSFLPDRDREEKERQEKLRLRMEWLAEQERIKEQEVNVTYSFYDGSGHRREMMVKKGMTIGEFLGQVRREFKELKGVSTENLMFIKEDVILPQHYSFYELIVTKARGKSGPLFHWDVHDDVRALADATLEKEESHAPKVVERRFYESNKHIFPMNRWEIWDPNKDYGEYTIKDNNKSK